MTIDIQMDLRISAIEKPRNPIVKLMYYFLKKEFGKVIKPARVIYSRYPKIGLLVKRIYDIEKSLTLIREEEKYLIQNFVATLNGCSFCMDISMRKSIDRNFSLEKFKHLMDYEKSEFYTLSEKAMFKYIEEMTYNISVSDLTYDQLRLFYTDEEIIEITYVAASENYLNRLVKPFNIGSDELCATYN